MNNSTLQSLLMDRERTAKRLQALNSVIEIYQGEITGPQPISTKGKHKLTPQQRRNIARGVRRARRLKLKEQNGNMEQEQENRSRLNFMEPQSA